MAEHHPLGDIQNLRSSLLKSYKVGFPILKELVQNAEDAEATCLDYGWIKGIPEAKHPLLQSPAIFILDNGKFTDENAESIRYIIGGSKSNQQNSIGKFGLGLKSVFHLCEAFFYIAPNIENPNYPRFDIFNPWAGAGNKDKYHEGWDYFTEEDRDLVKLRLSKILKEYNENWFIIWIPLRQKSHKADSRFLYIKDDEFFETSIPLFLANTRKELSLLPILLNKISRIRYWEDDLTQHSFEITVKSEERRHRLSEPQKKEKIKGDIAIDNENVIKFLGYEAISTSENFANIKESKGFPEEFRDIKPHYASIFNCLDSRHSDSSQSLLTVRTAVFLPIGNDSKSEMLSESRRSYYLTLHGYFFVDSGRTGIWGWNENNYKVNEDRETGDDDRSLVERKWNFNLYQVLLGSVLDSFNKFIDECKMSTDEISELCKALHSSKLFKEKSNREIICQHKQFILSITPQGEKWKLLNRKRVLPLPKIPDWDLFPKLKEKAESSEWLLTLSDAPNLRFFNLDFDKWDDLEIIEVLSNLSEKDVLKDSTAINFLILFLKQSCQNSVSDKIQESLIKLIKQGLSQLTWDSISLDIRKKLKELVDLIFAPKVVYIDVSEDIFRDFLKIEVGILFLPKKLFDHPSNNSSQLNIEDATITLSTLNDWINQLNKEGKSYLRLELILKQILVLSKNHIADILFENPEWKCLIGEQYLQKIVVFYSYNEFLNFKIKSILFEKPDTNSIQDALIASLVKASNEIQPILVDKKIANLIKNIEPISPVVCDISICKQILGANDHHPSLAEPENRKQLLTELLK